MTSREGAIGLYGGFTPLSLAANENLGLIFGWPGGRGWLSIGGVSGLTIVLSIASDVGIREQNPLGAIAGALVPLGFPTAGVTADGNYQFSAPKGKLTLGIAAGGVAGSLQGLSIASLDN